MSKEATGSFRTFLGKVSGKVKGKGDDPELAKDQKEHRREQVRKAQREHREREQNYTKQLEQDVIRLRGLICEAEAECVTSRDENAAMKAALSFCNIPVFDDLAVLNDTQQADTALSTTNFETQPSPIDTAALGSKKHQMPSSLTWIPAHTPAHTASVNFDQGMNTHCLHISSQADFNTTSMMASQDMPSLPIDPNSFPSIPTQQPASQAYENISTSYPEMPAQPDTSDIAVNFILALEHFCRTHFYASKTDSGLERDPTGHELTVSAILYAHAPTSAFEFSDDASWPVPSFEISQLWQMSQNLTKADCEITPVQAWFLLTGRYNVKELLGDGGVKLNALKQALGKAMGCCGYGVGMHEDHFWEVVEEIMEGRTSTVQMISNNSAPQTVAC